MCVRRNPHAKPGRIGQHGLAQRLGQIRQRALGEPERLRGHHAPLRVGALPGLRARQSEPGKEFAQRRRHFFAKRQRRQMLGEHRPAHELIGPSPANRFGAAASVMQCGLDCGDLFRGHARAQGVAEHQRRARQHGIAGQSCQKLFGGLGAAHRLERVARRFGAGRNERLRDDVQLGIGLFDGLGQSRGIDRRLSRRFALGVERRQRRRILQRLSRLGPPGHQRAVSVRRLGRRSGLRDHLQGARHDGIGLGPRFGLRLRPKRLGVGHCVEGVPFQVLPGHDGLRGGELVSGHLGGQLFRARFVKGVFGRKNAERGILGETRPGEISGVAAARHPQSRGHGDVAGRGDSARDQSAQPRHLHERQRFGQCLGSGAGRSRGDLGAGFGDRVGQAFGGRARRSSHGPPCDVDRRVVDKALECGRILGGEVFAFRLRCRPRIAGVDDAHLEPVRHHRDDPGAEDRRFQKFKRLRQTRCRLLSHSARSHERHGPQHPGHAAGHGGTDRAGVAGLGQNGVNGGSSQMRIIRFVRVDGAAFPRLAFERPFASPCHSLQVIGDVRPRVEIHAHRSAGGFDRGVVGAVFAHKPEHFRHGPVHGNHGGMHACGQGALGFAHAVVSQVREFRDLGAHQLGALFGGNHPVLHCLLRPLGKMQRVELEPALSGQMIRPALPVRSGGIVNRRLLPRGRRFAQTPGRLRVCPRRFHQSILQLARGRRRRLSSIDRILHHRAHHSIVFGQSLCFVFYLRSSASICG